MAGIRAVDHAIIRGRPEDAREHLRRAKDAFHAFGPAMEALYELGWVQVARAAGDLDGAVQALERPLEILRTTTDCFLLSFAQGDAAVLRARAGDPSALELAAEAVAATRKFPAPLAVVMALARAGQAAVVLERPDDARPLIVELVDTLRQLGTRRWVAEAHELAAIVLGDNEPDTGAIALGAAERLRTALNEPRGRAFVLARALDAATDRMRAALGPEDFLLQRARGVRLPVDEALALVAARLRNGGQRLAPS